MKSPAFLAQVTRYRKEHTVLGLRCEFKPGSFFSVC